jgi:hypothetical protein
MGAEWNEIRPYELPESATGWHLIWLNGRVMAFQVKSTGDEFMFIETNNGETHKLWQREYHWIAYNAPPPPAQKLDMSDMAWNKRNRKRQTEPSAAQQLTASSPLNRKRSESPPEDDTAHLSSKEVDSMLFGQNAQNGTESDDMFAGQDLSGKPDNNALGINNQIGRSK